jgi:hypothetical protein
MFCRDGGCIAIYEDETSTLRFDTLRSLGKSLNPPFGVGAQPLLGGSAPKTANGVGLLPFSERSHFIKEEKYGQEGQRDYG